MDTNVRIDETNVAIIGGGITGTVAATTLAKLLPGARITLFDQGRGLGGRASHRRVHDGNVVAPTANAAMAFDHGCQFFRADDDEFRDKILDPWLEAGLAAEWRGTFAGAGDFFGLGGAGAGGPVYVGKDGMHQVTAGAVERLERDHPNFVARRGVRVGAVARAGDRWALSGVGGEAAIHDSTLTSAEVEAARAAAALGEWYDAVIVTDASAAQESWHRASAGIPEAFLAIAHRVQDRVRVAMFTAIVAFDEPVPVDYDASAFEGAGALWFAARTNSKPGCETLEKECWTLVSTPAWAAAEVERVPMRDAAGAFIAQSKECLEAPAHALLAAFAAEVGKPLPAHSYLYAQRWGSAFPAPLTHGRDADGRSAAVRESGGTAFDASPTGQFAGLGGGGGADSGGGGGASDFVYGYPGFYYAGDFCSPRPPGVVAAALSGRHAAEACARRLR
jgi:predicted NAD/FAD-dependent oxidoreductase